MRLFKMAKTYVIIFQALEALDEDILNSLKENPAELRQFLMMHIVTPKRYAKLIIMQILNLTI